MSTTTTPRLGLVKPTPGTGEPVNRGTMNSDYDKIDAAVGAAIVTEATKPASPWDGQFIRTTDTRRLYVWNATQSAWDVIAIPLGGVVEATPSSTDVWKSRVTGDSQNRFAIQAGGPLFWGSGAAALDTNLYRGAANLLKTDDSLQVVQNLQVDGNISVAGLGQWKSVYKTTFQDRTSTTTLANDNHLTFANVASAEYHFRLVLYVTGSINGDIKLGFTFPTGAGGATITWMGYGIDSTTATQAGALHSAGFIESTTADQTLAFNAHGNGVIVIAEGYIIFGTTVGALTVRHAQQTSNATATSIRKGSRLDWLRVA